MTRPSSGKAGAIHLMEVAMLTARPHLCLSYSVTYRMRQSWPAHIVKLQAREKGEGTASTCEAARGGHVGAKARQGGPRGPGGHAPGREG